MYEFKVGDTGKTRGGLDYRVICVDGKLYAGYRIVALVKGEDEDYETTIAYRNDGKYENHTAICSGLDLLPPPQKRTVWVNFYQNGGPFGYPSREGSDEAAKSSFRIACVQVEIEFTPGEGL